MYESQSEVVVEMAKTLMTFIRDVSPSWKAVYYRFYSIEGETAANASYVDDSEATLIGAMRNREFYDKMRVLSDRLLKVLNKPRGVILLSAKSDFTYDVRFEFEDMEKWKITKMDGGSGIPEGYAG